MSVKKVKRKHKTVYQADFYFQGNRIRQNFNSEKEAESFIERTRKSVNEDEIAEIFFAVRERKIGFSEFRELWNREKRFVGFAE